MVNTPGIPLEDGKDVSGTNKITVSTTSNLDEVLSFLNITIMKDEDAESFFNTHIKNALIAAKDNKEQLDGAYLIYIENIRGGRKRSEFGGIDDARKILSKNPEAKIVLLGLAPEYFLKKEKKGADFVLAHPNVVFVDILNAGEKFKQLKFSGTVNKEKFLGLADEEAKKKMLYIRHALQGVKDPYTPKDESERNRVEGAFKNTQECFPGLDTLDKMLDFVLHVNIDLPEKMKGQRIEGVYCDVDGTLIEYVGIHSGKEGTQKLRKNVVELLKKYEQEGKQIIIWTGGDAKKKETYLRTLGITWPVVNKYDYAGASAEIVIDDTDQNAFIVQSKIYPEIYIDTRNFT